jgi:hypothetical protein
MPTSSAKPGQLRACRDAGVAQVEQWEPEVTNLDTALSTLRSALSGLDLPEGCGVSVLFYETWFDTLTANQRHLDEWVGDVADEFVRAGGGDPNGEIDANWSVTADDSEIVVGYADRAESERQAAEDAEALDEILGEAGILHPYDVSNNPEMLEELTEQYPELVDILARSAQFANDESYAVTLVNELGSGNVRTMVDLANTFGLAANRGDLPSGEAYDDYVVPLATILGNADRSGRMDESVREALFDMDATDEPPMADLSTRDYERELSTMRHRSLALILAAGEFSPQTTAEMADTLLQSPRPDHLHDFNHSGFTDYQFLEEHRALASNEWAALDALAEDDHAANIFYSMDEDGDGHLENLYVMGYTPGAEVAAERLGVPVDDIRGEIDQTVADSVTGGILEHPLATGTTYDADTVDLVTQMIEVAGGDHFDAADPVRTALAQVTTPYTRDIAIAAEGYATDLPDGRLPGLDDGTIDAFLQEVSESEQARVVLGQNAAALVTEQIGEHAPAIAAGNQDAFARGEVLAEAYYRELGEAWNEVQIGWVEQREALVAGWRSLTDPVVDVVSGKIVEKIPVVNVAADLPLASNVVDGITGGIKDGINSAVYDNLIPEPELEAMTTWRDAVADEVYDAVAEGLYENAETRGAYVEQANDPDSGYYEPEVYEQITADGEVTADEFRELEGVANAVLHRGNDIVEGFESNMAFNEVFGDR